MATSRKFTARLAAALAVSALLLAVALERSRALAAAASSEQTIAEALTCQCGCALTVANCNHPNCSFSVPMRAKIEAMLAKGLDRGWIIAFFRHEYGEKILSSPTTEGFNLLAWLMPFAALSFGIAGIVLVLWRWKTIQLRVVERDPTADRFDPALKARLERDLNDDL